MNRLKELIDLVPKTLDFQIEWDKIENSVMSFYAGAMSATQQNLKHHSEGDVWIHTKMVCSCLVEDTEFQALDDRPRQELFLAALFHDVGKIYTTRKDNGEWTSPNHALVGANLVRDLLWREYGICGTKDLQSFRETICLLVRYHMIAPYVLEAENPEYRLIKTAANGELAPDFTLKLLLILSKADSNGRISGDNQKGDENVLLAAELAKETECYIKPKQFASPFTEFAYLSGRNVSPETELYNNTKFEVIMMCGLPGTGKDTWIKTVYPDYPMISLDEIRKEYKISPTDNQQEVVRIAKSRAKQLLRQKRSFVWNATSVTPDIRTKLISLFTSYHAYVKIVFLETDYAENLFRNKNRKDVVPQSVIDKMLAKFTPPERFEAHKIEWLCI